MKKRNPLFFCCFTVFKEQIHLAVAKPLIPFATVSHCTLKKCIWRFHTKKIQRYGTFCDKCEQLMQLISPNGYYIAEILFFFFFKQELLYPPAISKTKKPKPNSNDQNQYWPLICSGVWMQALEKYNTLNDRDTFISSLFWSSLCFLRTFWWNTAIKINH